ncbi:MULTISPECIES: enoyl-CoA hydratase [Spongiibacter]|uniref:enoyl-CoA hydratase n=1 Tax=Spongiibacter TaxID=630749 RepID=UPI001B0D55F5|nr:MULTISPECIES: enoyl-CoA hydratase [Spongiibacter]MBO6753314.1 enoyl-CoA hydratase [Spongiibacter sp.]|tara:strand:- start:3147 stop:3935 length:789 start_codon:yes stop_codon:yes gene_type:complete
MSTSPTEKLLLDICEHTAVITINNPPANTWDAESLIGLRQIVSELNVNRDIYALVITGSGDKFFSAGADLKMFASGDKAVAQDIGLKFGQAFEALADFRGVSIAAVNGFAMGGGLECAMACDIRIVERQAKLALPEAKVGLLPCAGGTQRLTALVGPGWAKRMILCGERIDAETAQRIGLAEEVVDSGEAKSAAMNLAASVAAQSPVAVSFCKELIHEARDAVMPKGLILERERFIQLFDTADQKEGVNAFLEKRQPEWKNA